MRSVRLKMLATVNPTCQRFESLPDDAEIAFVPMEGVGFNTLEPEARSKADVATGYTRFENGDVLLPKIAPTFAHGRVVAAAGLTRGVGTGTTELHVLRPGPDVDARWLRYVMLSEPFLQQGIASYYGVAGQKRISLDWLVNYRAPLIPRDEQRRIADYLDAQCVRIDALNRELTQQLSLLAEHEAAVRDGMIWGGVSETLPLRSLVHPARPVTYGIVLPGPDVDEGVLIVKGGNVTPGGLAADRLSRTTAEIEAAYSRSRLRANDLVIAIRGSIGSVEIVPQEIEGANLTQDAARISPADGVNATWLAEVMRSGTVFSALEAGATGATIRGINIRDLRKVRVPRAIKVQQERIVDELGKRLRVAGALGSEYVRQRGLLREHCHALITAAVTGQFDVSSAA